MSFDYDLLTVESCNELRRAKEYFERRLFTIERPRPSPEQTDAYCNAVGPVAQNYRECCRLVARLCAPWFEVQR